MSASPQEPSDDQGLGGPEAHPDSSSLPTELVGCEGWRALIQDSGACITVWNAQGRLVFANPCAVHHICLEPAAARGRSILDLLPSDVAQERLGIIHRVLQDSTPILVDGMIRGVLSSVTYRPVRLRDDDQGPTLVLSICHPAAVTHYPPEGVVRIRARVDDLGVLDKLTNRETEVLRLIGMGLSTADIAKTLHRSVKTIEWHRVSLGNKLGVSNRVELARMAIRAGLSPVTHEGHRDEAPHGRPTPSS